MDIKVEKIKDAGLGDFRVGVYEGNALIAKFARLDDADLFAVIKRKKSKSKGLDSKTND